ncbi:helix-turn-helix transcriptional regulator [Ensifer adhaerens]
MKALDFSKADRFLKLKEVMAMTSLGSTTIYRFMHAGKFPKSRQLGANCVRWRRSEIEQWMNTLPTVEYGKWADTERRPLDT